MTQAERRGLAIFVFLFAFLMPLSVASAHTSGQFWLDTWPSGDIAYDMTTAVPGGLGSNQHDQIAAGGQKWNALTNFITFKRSGNDVAGFNHLDCSPGDSHADAIHWLNLANFVGWTEVCQNVIGTVMAEFQMTFDNGTNWYYGTTGVPAGYRMISGVSAHEFGHAAGGWVGNNGLNHFTADNTNGLCETSVALASLHTMCRFDDRFVGNNQQGSLEAHDIDTFQFWY